MTSLQTIYSILFEDFKPKETTKILGEVDNLQKAIIAKKQRTFDILLDKKSKESDAQSDLKKYMEKYGALPELGQYLFGSSFVPQNPESWHKEAKQAFQRINQEYRYFGQNSENQSVDLYLDCYKFCISQYTTRPLSCYSNQTYDNPIRPIIDIY